MSNAKSMIIDGVKYIREDMIDKIAETYNGLKYVIVRTYSAGVFAGHLKKREGQEVELIKARRIWSWKGAASLSQLAMEGTSDPQGCKFPCEVESVELLQAVEIIPCMEKARKSISEVPIWKK